MDVLDIEIWLPFIVTIILIYFPTVALYRLFLHPLAQFPGPKLAAITRWYEAYYDVICDGQYTFKLAELHQEYGPIIRISPHELHVNDPSFFEKLYRQDGRWDKYDWCMEAFGAQSATIHTVDHYAHKRRRAALNPFFSRKKVADSQNIIQRATEKLCYRLCQFQGTDNVHLGSAISALTRDVSTEFLFGRSFNHLDDEDFHSSIITMHQNGGKIWRVTKHMRWYDIFTASSESSQRDLKEDSQEKHTLVHQILESDLPRDEKTLDRLYNDVVTISSAGFETSAHVMRNIIYYVYKNDEILRKLRDELSLKSESPDLIILEQLPFLTGVIMEGLRLGMPVSSRLARVAPDRELVYGKWRIPAGAPVGMTPLLLNQNDTLYPDPRCFVPERWMAPGVRKNDDRVFAPFGRGTRNCLGQHLAWAEIYIVIAALVQRFDFDLDGIGPEDVEAANDKFLTGTTRQNGFKVFVKRI
ncbi:trichodiene oxygenase [Hypoxylon trugodes]|uniref:trichodiene oxygenase n=1 Tax=Hypoxylon trugodes TaxID=326681 RepID=UPI00219F817F|nr:trichodiene oxygenase [Hypoxylon trugodes]KAI1392904.1 trichodiene oxygenase [Hypoxylon trugodes]